ncbi:putative methyltransferase NSUN7 isoform X1 [Canis lupus familiaris]|uniref:NOP2/Sun RNA methyltransferase family member 7 n=1 Tax=Canis lupus familiaris TaxID=9615 RepID=A0A8I3MRK4_CANLF|nr:putative methyltransferase NSUN7 isoform X1 [Canis lupus familiaris]XP_038516535.1 putative methyltransferase NSUN7 isoform X1 [Canis lupus familiaris]
METRVPRAGPAHPPSAGPEPRSPRAALHRAPPPRPPGDRAGHTERGPTARPAFGNPSEASAGGRHRPCPEPGEAASEPNCLRAAPRAPFRPQPRSPERGRRVPVPRSPGRPPPPGVRGSWGGRGERPPDGPGKGGSGGDSPTACAPPPLRDAWVRPQGPPGATCPASALRARRRRAAGWVPPRRGLTEITACFHRRDARGARKTVPCSVGVVAELASPPAGAGAAVPRGTGEPGSAREPRAEDPALSARAPRSDTGPAGAPESTGFPDAVYVTAANIFQGIRLEKSPEHVLIKYGDEPLRSLPESEDESVQRSSYELAFSALKFQDILETILIDSYIFPSTTIPDHLSSLIIVMLYDFQDRKFQARLLSDNEEPIAEVQEVESLLNSFKTKLAAALARCRIKHDALSIYHILPETIRNQELRASTLPLYAWINTCKISPEEVYYSLKKKGYHKVKSVLHIDDKVFAVDQHCHDVLIFPSHLKNDLLNIDLFKDYKLILQDKSRSLAVHSVRALLNMDDDILMVNTGSWYTVAHMSVLTNNNTSKIFVCGVKSQAKDPDLKNLFTKMGCKNIEILHETFLNIESKDHRLQKVKVILLLPRCSGLGVSNPVEFILNEHEDTGLLKDFSQGGTSEDKLHILAQQQYEQLTHAMKFTKAQAVVYCTCSVYPEENEAVVKKALEFQDLGNKVQPYRLSPPVLPMCSLKEIHLSTDKFFRMEPSEITNGCFLSVLTRERDPSETVSVKDVLARAAAKGLLDGIELGKSSKREKKKKKSKTSLPKAPTNDNNGIQMKIAEFLNRETNAKANRPEILTKTSLPQKNATPASSSSQVRKPGKPANNPLAPTLTKNAAHPRPYERQTSFLRPRSEDRVIALKPIEIVLPPVMLPFSSSQGIKSQLPTQHFYYRWVGPKTVMPSYFPSPSITRRGEKPKENLPSSLLRRPRPWL